MILGVTGLIGSGKDTIADYLVTEHGFKRISFAASLKDATAALFGWDRELLEGTTKQSRKWRETVDPWWSERLNMPHLTPRYVLQYLGTEVFRNHFHTDIWVASVENKLRQTKDDIVITDCRFANEFASIQQADGCLIRINRDRVIPVWSGCATTQNNASADELAYLQTHNMTMDRLYPTVHASEWNWVGRSVSYVIDNTGTLSELHDHLDQMVFAEFAHSKVAD